MLLDYAIALTKTSFVYAVKSVLINQKRSFQRIELDIPINKNTLKQYQHSI